MKTATPTDMAWLLRPMKTEDAKKAWIKAVGGVAVPLSFMPAIEKYRATVTEPMEQLKTGRTAPDLSCWQTFCGAFKDVCC